MSCSSVWRYLRSGVACGRHPGSQACVTRGSAPRFVGSTDCAISDEKLARQFAHRADQLLQRRFLAVGAGVDRRVRQRVEPFALGQDRPQLDHRVLASAHRAQIALGDHAIHVVLGTRAQPDRQAAPAQQLVGLRLHHQRAAGRDHAALVVLDQAGERAALAGAIGVLAVHREDALQRHAELAFDLLVQFEERHLQLGGELRTQCRLAGTPQSDQCDPAAATGVDALTDQFVQVRAQRGSHATDQQDRDVAVAGFELREITLGDPGALGQAAPGQPRLRARAPHPQAELAEERRLVGCLSCESHELQNTAVSTSPGAAAPLSSARRRSHPRTSRPRAPRRAARAPRRPPSPSGRRRRRRCSGP